MSKRFDEDDSRFKDLDAFFRQAGQKSAILLVAQSTDGLAAAVVFRVAVRECNIPRRKKAGNAVIALFAVHVLQIVGLGIKRHKRRAGSLGETAEELVKEGFPGNRVQFFGLRHNPIKVEQNRVKVCG